jgi:hypothetical protein
MYLRIDDENWFQRSGKLNPPKPPNPPNIGKSQPRAGGGFFAT